MLKYEETRKFVFFPSPFKSLFLVGGIVNLAEGKIGALDTGFQQQDGIDSFTAASGAVALTYLSIISIVITIYIKSACNNLVR